TVVALVTGALVLAPVTSAFATETEVEAPTTVVPESQDAQSDDSETEAAESGDSQESAENAEAGETGSDEAAEKIPAEQTPRAVASAETAKAAEAQSTAADAAVDVQIAGKAVVGEKLQASAVVAPTAAVAPGTPAVKVDAQKTTYTWRVDGADVAKAATYKVRTKDFDKEVEVVANVALTGATAHAKTVSKKTAKVKKQQASVKAKVRVSGKALIGKTLKAKTTIVKKSKGVKVKSSYTWLANGKKVGSGKTYTVKSKDRNKRIRAVAKLTWNSTSTFANGSKQTRSSATKKVKKQKSKVSARLQLNGTAKVGNTLQAVALVKSNVRVKNSFSWYVNGKKVKSGSKFKVKSEHAGKEIKVVYKAKWGSKKFTKGSKKRVKTRNVAALTGMEAWMTAAGIPKKDWNFVRFIAEKESGTNPHARNASSGACGLIQALPCSKVPGNGLDPVDNLRWAHGYASKRYGGWSAAYAFWSANHWW
ncbi:MAG: transglycosylase SLT domain-containing protein, partial [Leucobacter sp.]